ncbi:MAG: DEAD/DEAH box helicase [Syntrophaceae bacterium]|nr:DEAD/DEAH box helicase [Syntrophaceae bacterium]
MQLTPCHAKYFAYELTKRCSSNSLEKLAASLSDAQVDLNPHQVEAALFAFRSPLSKGALLADEVGLGKTIEAGILLSQKWAERKRKLLIIVPSSLRKQWNQELLDKFFLPSLILETKSFNLEIKKGNLNPFNHDEIVICSYHFARSKDVYIKQMNWDLIVIDEAHHLRNVYKPTNKIANTIKDAVALSPKILLTATPLQNTLLELYGLVSVIDDYAFGDLKSFKSQFSRLTGEDNFDDLKGRLKPICQRTLRRQVLEYIKYTNRIPITQEFYPTENEQKLYNLVSDYLQSPNLYALPASQRQLMTLILRKLLASSTFAISGTLEALAKRLEVIIDHHAPPLAILEEAISQNIETFDEVKEEWAEEDDESAPEEPAYTAQDLKLIRAEIHSLHDFHALAKSIQKNSKGEVLLTALQKGFVQAQEKGANKKAVIYTESTRTQEYLKRILDNTEYKGKVVLFNGSNNDRESRELYKKWLAKHEGTDRVTGSKTADMRAALVDCFRDEAEILIATEAGAEGINLQFCSLVVNYDLPWNPQRIEQRIGRCHRYGQKHDVVVVNFLNKKNAADQRVYQLLSEKFRLFEGVFGASDEVLGTIESGVDFERRIAQIYQSCRTEEEIQSAFDALQKEMETEIDETLNITRQRLLENFDEEVHEKLRVNLRESKKYLSRYENWLWELTRYYLAPYADFASDDHSFMLRKNPFPDEKIHSGPYRIGKNIDDANTYRAGHPLAQRIIETCRSLFLPRQELAFHYSTTPKKITILESLVNKAGWLSVANLTISSFETEDHILFCGLCDDGTELDEEICQRLFSLPATTKLLDLLMNDAARNLLSQIVKARETGILQETATRNAGFFDTEMGKLEKWAEDIKSSLEIELKELDKEIKFRKTEAKKIPNLEEKVSAQRHIKELEKKRNTLRMNLYQAQDEVDVRKDKLIENIEARLKQKLERNELFLIRWKII